MANYFDNSVALRLKPFEGSVAEILDELSSGKSEILDNFLVDPTGYLASKLVPGAAASLPQTKLNSANDFLFKALVNPKFRSWMDNYNLELEETVSNQDFAELDEGKIKSDVAQALAEFGDASLLEALFDSPLSDSSFDVRQFNELRERGAASISPGIAMVVWLVVVATVAAVALAVIMNRTGSEVVRSDRLGRFKLSGEGMANIADLLIAHAESLKSSDKI